MQYELLQSANDVLVQFEEHTTPQFFFQPISNPQRKNILSIYASDAGADDRSRASGAKL